MKQIIRSANICLLTNGDVHTAYCVCPAGLVGCCNHVAALLPGSPREESFALQE